MHSRLDLVIVIQIVIFLMSKPHRHSHICDQQFWHRAPRNYHLFLCFAGTPLHAAIDLGDFGTTHRGLSPHEGEYYRRHSSSIVLGALAGTRSSFIVQSSRTRCRELI